VTLVYSLVALQIADLATTLYILRRGGRELNPLLVKLQGVLGLCGAIIAAKAVVVALVLLVPIPPILLALLCVWYAYIVGRNLLEMRRKGVAA